MVHTRPDLPGRWARYYQLPTRERRQLAAGPNRDFEQRITRNLGRKIHPELGMNINEMHIRRLNDIINFQGWGHFITQPAPYDPDLVKEFYAAMVPPAFGEWSTVVVRGTRVRITMDDICRHYQVPRRAILDRTYGIPSIPDVAQDDQYNGAIAANLRRNGRHGWIPKRDMIKKTELRPEIAMLLRFVKCRLAPSTHYSTVDWYVARILYCLQNNMLIDIGHIIVLHMMDAAAERCAGILPFPSLITNLCREAGVEIGETMPPPPPFDRTTYRAHVSAVRRQEESDEESDNNGDDEDVDEEAADVEYNPAEDEDEDEEPEDPRILARLDRLEANVNQGLATINQGMYNLSMLIRGRDVPEDAFPAPDEAGPSNPRPARQHRRRRNE